MSFHYHHTVAQLDVQLPDSVRQASQDADETDRAEPAYVYGVFHRTMQEQDAQSWYRSQFPVPCMWV